MKLILIDSGLKNIKGHNFSTDLYIAQYFKEKNFDVEILCLKNIDKEVEDKFVKNKIKIKKYLIYQLIVLFHMKMKIQLLNLSK